MALLFKWSFIRVEWLVQGSHAPRKTGKSREFRKICSRSWKSREFYDIRSKPGKTREKVRTRFGTKLASLRVNKTEPISCKRLSISIVVKMSAVWFSFGSFMQQEIGRSSLKYDLNELLITDEVKIHNFDLSSIQKAKNIVKLTIKSKHLLLKCHSYVDQPERRLCAGP